MATDVDKDRTAGGIDFAGLTDRMRRELRKIEVEGEEMQRWLTAYFERIGASLAKDRRCAASRPRL